MKNYLMTRAETAVWRNNDRVFLQPRENTVFPRKISAKQARPNDLRIPFTSSLRWKVALSFSVVLMLVVAFLFAGFMWYERVFLFQETQKRAKSLVNNLVINARDPLLSQDDLRLGPIIASISQDPEVQSAYLLDLQGRVLYHSDSRRTGRWLIDGVPSPDKGIIQASMPIEVENMKVGTAVVGLGVDHIDQAMMKTAMGLLLPLGLGVGLGILGIFYLAGIHVDRIKRLEEAVQALGSGDLLVHVEDSSLDEVGRLTGYFNKMVGQLHSARQQNERNFRETIRSLAAAVEAKDAYTRAHCDRVARISAAIGKRLEISEKECEDLELAAILHDVGKIGVKAGILGKIGPLTDEEFQEIQHHPDIGARILSPLTSLHRVGLFVRHHHENYDGSGYPDGLKEDAIPQASRIIHLVDAFDAMTTNRPYRKALSREEAFSRIKKERGKQFDPVPVDMFFQLEEEGRIDAISEEVEQSNKQ